MHKLKHKSTPLLSFAHSAVTGGRVVQPSHWRARTTDLEEDDVRPTADAHSIFSRPPQGGHILNGQVTELLILKILRIFCSIPQWVFLARKTMYVCCALDCEASYK